MMSRVDGRRIRTLDPFTRMMPYIMERRSDAQNFSKQVIETEALDAYLKEKRKDGHKFTYLHFFIAVFVRVLALRPQLNRFVVNRAVYARNNIEISMVIKRTLVDDGQETTVKFSFSGKENIFDAAAIVDAGIQESIGPEASNETDKIAARIMSLPAPLIGMAVRFLKWLDRMGILPRSIIAASPFHTSVFFTYLKSIKLDYIYHHLYDFGTTGIFIALGRNQKIPRIENGQMVIRNCCEVGFVLDERICDGLYFANSLQLMKRFMDNPYLLEEALDARAEDQP
jgi:hypothetical protein